jgi:hypothetical protein
MDIHVDGAGSPSEQNRGGAAGKIESSRIYGSATESLDESIDVFALR